MEAHAGAVDDLQPLSLLHGQIHQLGAVLQVSERLTDREGDKLNIRATIIKEKSKPPTLLTTYTQPQKHKKWTTSSPTESIYSNA